MSDLISRQAAIETVINGVCLGCDCDVIDKLKALPTTDPKKGKWIDYCGGVKCDQCGFECDDTYYLGEANFCPNCGARMEESE